MAVRSLLRRPGFTAMAVFTLAVAAAANAAILAVVYGVLLRPLPYRDPSQLVAVWPGRFQSNADLAWLRDRSPMFTGLAAIAPGWTMSLTGSGDPRKVTVARVSGNLFELLGVQPIAGRVFREADARTGSDQVVILTHDLWTKQFGGDRGIVSRTIALDGDRYEVVGVLPAAFEVFGLKTDAYTTLALDPAAWYHRLSFSLLVGRLAPGRGADQAERDYRALLPGLRQAHNYSNDYGHTARLQDLRSATVGEIRTGLVSLAAAVALILLIAGANVGTLLLTRAAGRTREIAVRSAVGASRSRIMRELLAEGALLSLAGGGIGTLAAWIGMPAFVRLLPPDTPRLGDIAIDWTVAGAVLSAATVVGLLFAVAPALTATRIRTGLLVRAGTSSETRQSKRLRGALVVAEIALAIVLASGAALMVQSFVSLQRVNPGFSPDRVLTLQVLPNNVGYKQARPTNVFYDVLLERLRAVPGVQSAGAIQHLPFSGYSWTAQVDIEGHPVPEGDRRPVVEMRIVTPDYFRAVGQPLIAGRSFAAGDASSQRTVIVNQALARTFFGRESNALNRTLRVSGGGLRTEWMTIVGVVADVRHTSLATPAGPEIYTSVTGTSIPAMMLAIRTEGDPLSLAPAVREAIWSIDRHTPIADLQTLSTMVGASLARPRMIVSLLGGFAVIGLVLALVGVYGVVTSSLAQRTHEIGIRLALGAERRRILRLILKDGVVYAAAGLVLGIPAALAATRLLQTMLFGIEATDVLTYAGLSVSMVAVVLAASYVPARRATRVDPLVALKHD